MPRDPSYPRSYNREIWDAPQWVFAPKVTLSSVEAAKFLGISRRRLTRYADEYGLTVLRRPSDKNLFFFRSELRRLKEEMDALGANDVISAIKGDRDAVLG